MTPATSVSMPWWTLPLTRDQFMARAAAERARIAESTFGDWVGKRPTTVTPETSQEAHA